MKVIIREKADGSRVVRVEIGNPVKALEMPCDDDVTAAAYAQGVVDGARYLRSEMEVPFSYHRQPADQQQEVG